MPKTYTYTYSSSINGYDTINGIPALSTPGVRMLPRMGADCAVVTIWGPELSNAQAVVELWVGKSFPETLYPKTTESDPIGGAFIGGLLLSTMPDFTMGGMTFSGSVRIAPKSDVDGCPVSVLFEGLAPSTVYGFRLVLNKTRTGNIFTAYDPADINGLDVPIDDTGASTTGPWMHFPDIEAGPGIFTLLPSFTSQIAFDLVSPGVSKTFSSIMLSWDGIRLLNPKLTPDGVVVTLLDPTSPDYFKGRREFPVNRSGVDAQASGKSAYDASRPSDSWIQHMEVSSINIATYPSEDKAVVPQLNFSPTLVSALYTNDKFYSVKAMTSAILKDTYYAYQATSGGLVFSGLKPDKEYILVARPISSWEPTHAPDWQTYLNGVLVPMYRLPGVSGRGIVMKVRTSKAPATLVESLTEYGRFASYMETYNKVEADSIEYGRLLDIYNRLYFLDFAIQYYSLSGTQGAMETHFNNPIDGLKPSALDVWTSITTNPYVSAMVGASDEMIAQLHTMATTNWTVELGADYTEILNELGTERTLLMSEAGLEVSPGGGYRPSHTLGGSLQGLFAKVSDLRNAQAGYKEAKSDALRAQELATRAGSGRLISESGIS